MPLKDDFFTRSRVKNPWANVIFGQQEEPPLINRRAPPPQDFSFNNPALDEYADHIRGMPKQEDYAPSIWRKLLAGTSGVLTGYQSGNPLLAYDAANRIARAPYRNAMEEWQGKEDALKSSAQLENTFNTQRRLYGGLNERTTNNAARTGIAETNSRTQIFNAETARKRAEFAQKIAEATDANVKTRLMLDQSKFEQQTKVAEAKLRMEDRRVGAYERNVGSMIGDRASDNERLGRDDVSDTQLAARRRDAVDRVANENPEWFDNNGIPLPETSELVEAQIQRYMQPRRYGNINLEPGSNTRPSHGFVLER